MAADKRVELEVAVKTQGVGKLGEIEDGLEGLGKGADSGAAGLGRADGAAKGFTSTSTKLKDGLDSVSIQLAEARNQLLAFAGVSSLAQSVQSVAQLADQWANLKARLQLALGAQTDINQAMADVQGVAQRTYTSLEATATLYGKIAAAGKEMGISQQQVLALTETINQSVQLSGASAQASEAALTQLNQALQSGVVRGDEFNSIMEQAPRLSQAMADGLGVPIGALRGMAEQGQLTSARVIAALQSQSEAINREFGSLPVTIGRAVQNLQTEWLKFVGTLDSSTGASSAVADGITALATHLDDLARVAGLAGAALVVSFAAQAATAMRTAAAEMLATGGAAALLNTQLGKLSRTVQITVAVVGLEVGYQIGTMLYENSELARKLGVGIVGYAQAAVSSLQLIKDAGAAIFTSDTIDAALARFEERNQKIRDIVAAMWTDAEQAPAQIGAAADGAGAKVGAMGSAATAAGQASAAAGAAGAAGMAGIGKAADDARGALAALVGQLKAPVQVNPFSDVLKGLQDAQKKGVDLEAFLREKLPAAIEKLSGPELVKFRNEFAVAMIEAKASGKALEAGLALIGVQAAKSLGVDAVAASNQLGAEFEASKKKLDALIMTLPDLQAAGVDTAAVVGEALNKMIDGAKNQAELDAIKTKIEQVRQVLGDKIADGLLDQAKDKANALKDALDGATPGINSVREAMKALGITSDESLKKTAATAKEAYDTLTSSGIASARELAEAFKKSAEAAIAANQGIAPAWVEGQAAVRGYRIEVDAAGKSTLVSADAVDRAGRSHNQAAKNIDTHRTALERLNAEKEREIAAQEKSNQLKEREIALYEKKWAMDSQHRSLDADGKVREETGMPTQRGIYERAKSGGLNESDAIALAGSFDSNLLKQRTTGGTPYIDMQRLDDAIAEAVLNTARKGSSSGIGGGAVSSGGGATYISNITIPGVGSASPQFANAASQSQTEDLFRKLAQLKGASA